MAVPRNYPTPIDRPNLGINEKRIMDFLIQNGPQSAGAIAAHTNTYQGDTMVMRLDRMARRQLLQRVQPEGLLKHMRYEIWSP